MSSELAQPDGNTAHLRKRSVGLIELQDSTGRRNTVQLEDLTEADRALAEKFGYKPVREFSIDPSIAEALLPQRDKSQSPNATAFGCNNRSLNENSVIYRPSLSPSVLVDCLPQSVQPFHIRSTPEVPLLQSGAGPLVVLAACV